MDEKLSRLRAAGHPLRLRMLSLLTGAELSAAEVARELDLTHANASYHLRLLENAGLLVKTVAGASGFNGQLRSRPGSEVRALVSRLDLDGPGSQTVPDGTTVTGTGEVRFPFELEPEGTISPGTAARPVAALRVLTTYRPSLVAGSPRLEIDVDAARSEAVVSGAAVSPGVVEGIAKLILDPDGDDDLEPGEILVCRTTDPSWASLMMVASALVIDIGGAISHGAIVARELGIPCVTGTRNGTQSVRTGDKLRVDGSAGTVEILERAS